LTIEYMDSQDVVDINFQLVVRSERSILNKGSLEFTMEEVMDQFGDLSEHDAIIGKAAYLWYQIARGHFFINGNKRTGFITADTFLDLNGLDFVAGTGDKHFISGAIVSGVYDLDAVREDIAKYLK